MPPMIICLFAIVVLTLLTRVHTQRNVLPLAVHLPLLNTAQLPNVGGIVRALQLAESGLDRLHANYTFQVSYVATNLTLIDSSWALYESIQKGALGIIGDYLNEFTEPAALQAGLYGVYMCSGSATAQSLSMPDYRLFYRTIANAEQHGHAIAKFVRGIGWSNVNLVFHTEYRSIAEGFTRSATLLGISISTTQVLSADVMDHEPILSAMLQTGTLIHVFLGLPAVSVEFLRNAKRRGLMEPGNAWITPDSFSTALDVSNTTDWTRGILDGFLVAAPLEDAMNAQAEEFKQRWAFTYPDQPVPPYALLFRDCMYSMSEGLIRQSERYGYENVMAKNYPINLFALVRSFVGASGEFTLNNRGDRDQNFAIRNIFNGSISDFVHVPQGENATSLLLIRPATFPGGTTVQPADKITKQFIHHSWKTGSGLALGSVTVVVMAVVLISILYLFKHRSLGTVRHLSFPFLAVISVGCILTLLSTALSLDPTPTNCQSATWVFVWGIQLVLGAGMVKTYRIWSIFEVKNLAKVAGIHNKLLFAILSGILVVQTVILIVFTALDPWMHHSLKSGRTWTHVSCAIQPTSPLRIPFVVTNLIYSGLLAIAFLWFAFQTRNVAANYNESRFMYVTGQSVAMASIVVIVFALVEFDEAAPIAFLVKHWLIVAAVSFVFYCMVGRLVPDVRAQARDAKCGLQALHFKSGKASVSLTGSAKEASTSILKGTFPVRSTSLFSRWKSTHVRVIASEGIISFLSAMPSAAATGITIDLSVALVNPAVTLPPDLMCIQLFANGESWLIQFDTENERMHWAQIIATVASATSASVASAIGLGKLRRVATKGKGSGRTKPAAESSPKKQSELGWYRDEEVGQELKKTALSGSSAMLLGMGGDGTGSNGRLTVGGSGLLTGNGPASGSRDIWNGKPMTDLGQSEFFR
ncbi:periplasmic binding protein-like I [Catenaria anguillulae PL171]|uniref:Periplasmic binding protein-like I n=1 Tax=Catenaria anguillulae PL171 TaxID=765915 RepID=A0A1Y2HW45_9FUNG|nr:periplasmic binding protein-like I [Catenaria anguillulae PL171]